MVAKQNPSNGFCIAIVTRFGPCRGFPNRIQGGCCSHDDVNKPVTTECLNNNLLYNVALFGNDVACPVTTKPDIVLIIYNMLV